LEGLPGTIRIGKFGPFVEVRDGDGTRTASLPEGVAPADLSADQVERLVQAKAEGPDILGSDPATGKPVFLLVGRFGPYVQLGSADEESAEKPRRASLPKGVDPGSVTVAMALRLLALPRTLGKHPETGDEINAGIGRFGPFVVHQKDFRSLAPPDDVYTVTLKRALELLSESKRASGAQPLREIGAHPADGEPIKLFAGRYGPYVKHGSVNASLPKGADPDTLTVAAAVELLEARAAVAKPARGKARGSRSAVPAKGGARKAGVRKASKRAAEKGSPWLGMSPDWV
jgi:DNA topoisomerase-1